MLAYKIHIPYFIPKNGDPLTFLYEDVEMAKEICEEFAGERLDWEYDEDGWYAYISNTERVLKEFRILPVKIINKVKD